MRKKIFGLSLLLLLFISTQICAANNIISISQTVVVRSLGVKLSEIAHVKGDNQFREEINNIYLGQAPLPGYQRVIYRDEVIYALQDKGINIADIKLNIPYQFTVISDYKRLTVNKLTDFGKERILENLSYPAERVEIDVINPPQEIMIPYGDLEFKVGELNYTNLVGRATIPIEIIVNKKTYKRVYIQYKISVLKEVLIANSRIERGAFIDNSLFRVKEQWVSGVNKQLLAADINLEGKRMKVTIDANRALRKGMIETPPLVDRWQEVQIIARIGDVEVSTVGKALQPGHLGDVVKVQNLNSRQEVMAKVIAKDTVEVLIN